MRHTILLLFFFASFCDSYSQTTAPGYYVTKNNDSVIAYIKIPTSLFGAEDFSKFLFKVEIVDSINGTKKFKPEDINCFGFLYNENRYRFFSQPAITENNLRFLQPVVLGTKTSLYKFQTVDQNGKPLGSFYTFQKANGTYTFLSTGIRSLTKFKDALKEFYNDNLKVQQLIETKFQSRTSIQDDMIEIVQAVNNH